MTETPHVTETTRVMSPVLVGRSAELAELEAALRAAPGAVLIGGDAGLGKTRLIREFTARAADHGARTLAGGCLELGSDGLPFAPFTTVLRGLVRDIGIDGIAELLPRGDTSGLARLLPEFGEPEGDAASGQERARLFELVLILLERLAERAPLALVIEDAHWADRSTRDLLAFLIRNAGAAPLLIVVTYRADELHRAHPLRPLLAELGRVERVRRMELARLARADVAELVGRILGEEPRPGLVDLVHRRSEGNPLFVEALLDSDGTVACELPESLRDLLLAGVQRLPEETQEVLRDAAVGGSRIEHPLLAAVSRLDDAALSRTLRPAVAANVLMVEGDGYAFRHALIREAIHDDLLPGEHTRLHTRYAQALEEDPGLVPPGRLWVEISHHWHAAHDATWALVAAWRAAAESRKALAYAECLAMLSRVLELWERVPDGAERIAASHAEVLEEAAKAADDAGEYERGIKFASAALRALPDDPGTEVCRQRASLLELRGRMRYKLARPGFIEDMQEAVRVLSVKRTAVRARVLCTLAQYGRLTTGIGDARDAATEALEIATAIGDVAAEADARITLFCVDIDYDDDFGSLSTIEEAARRAGVHRLILRFAVIQSHFLEGAGRHAEAAEVARRGIAQAAEFGVARTEGTFLSINLAEPLVSLGRWDEAAQVLRTAREQDPPVTIRTSLEVLAGEVALLRGDMATARARLAGSQEIMDVRLRWVKTQDYFATLRLEAQLLLAEGRPDAAFDALRPVLLETGLPDDARYTWPVLLLGAIACTELDDPSRLAGLEARAAGLAARGPAQEAFRRAFEAEAAYARGRRDPAAWDAAAAAWAALDRPYPQAEALLRAAQSALTAGDHDGAYERLGTAAGIAARLGAAPLGERLAELTRRVRGPRRAGGGEGPLGLTPREVEVLRLVSAGHSNRDIAEELFISAKTASVHVSNILAKLGVTSRGEAAATARRLALFEPATRP
ncbi:HTH-type transcriptional regulator MalT [Actinomadura sp. RB68]|uniref:HTH-type transcriptional regulator MalT n=1 Tax=Actinomadura macrotermitis TaxID=2585200 RepID=A0A7K0BSW2_9ACTN|nr:HTH-type transcriptional regulator MalT [Actinomadura macrotermitis]